MKMRRFANRGSRALTIRVGAFFLLVVAFGMSLGVGPQSRSATISPAGVLSPASPALSMAQGVSVVADRADCTASIDGTARYFVSVRGSSGEDILHAAGRLIGTGSENAGQVANMSNGDLESQADDGSPPGCVPRPRDGRANDLGSVFVPAAAGTHTWNLRVLAAGYSPAPLIELAPYVDGTVCPLGDGSGCLISLGTIVLAGTPLPSTSGGSRPTLSSTASTRSPAPSLTSLVVAVPTGTPRVPTRTLSPSPDATGLLSPTPTSQPETAVPTAEAEPPVPTQLPTEGPQPAVDPMLPPTECPDALMCPEPRGPADPAAADE